MVPTITILDLLFLWTAKAMLLPPWGHSAAMQWAFRGTVPPEGRTPVVSWDHYSLLSLLNDIRFHQSGNRSGVDDLHGERRKRIEKCGNGQSGHLVNTTNYRFGADYL